MNDDDFCEMNNVIQRVSTELPASVRACCYYDDDGTAFILINAKCSIEQQRKSAKHELTHIKRGDNFNISYVEYAI